MRKFLSYSLPTCGIFFLLLFGVQHTSLSQNPSLSTDPKIGDTIDNLNGVYVYYNGPERNVVKRNVAADGYNLGLQFQCVEFIKRYYYEYLNHKMPDSYGHAKDFFNSRLKDGALNPARNLLQFRNPSSSQPQVSDILIYAPTTSNEFGHVAIVSKVGKDSIEIIQQNPGPEVDSRETYNLKNKDGYWHIENSRIQGWLRKKSRPK